jgi:hypothetical protein
MSVDPMHLALPVSWCCARRRFVVWVFLPTASTILGMVNPARNNCIDLGHCWRCRRPHTSLPSLEAPLRSSFSYLVASSLRFSRSKPKIWLLLERASVSASSLPPWGCCLGSFIVGQACAWSRDRLVHQSGGSRFRRCISCVAFVVELLGVGFGRLGVRSVGLAGARSWDRWG